MALCISSAILSAARCRCGWPSMYPERIASLTLYEPVWFSLACSRTVSAMPRPWRLIGYKNHSPRTHNSAACAARRNSSTTGPAVTAGRILSAQQQDRLASACPIESCRRIWRTDGRWAGNSGAAKARYPGAAVVRHEYA